MALTLKQDFTKDNKRCWLSYMGGSFCALSYSLSGALFTTDIVLH